MILYQLKIEIKPFKTDEFIKSTCSIVRRIRKGKDCLGFGVYRDLEKEKIYRLVGEWQTRPAMEKHFKTQDFEILVGVARFLGETFEMKVAEILETGGLNLIRERIASQKRGSAAAD